MSTEDVFDVRDPVPSLVIGAIGFKGSSEVTVASLDTLVVGFCV